MAADQGADDLRARLERCGWAVRCGTTWFAEARREGHIEVATGETREKALEELWQLTRLDEVEGCP